MGLNLLLSLIIQAKRHGKGTLSNGRIYTSLLLCISDFISENELLNCYNNEIVLKESYRKLERFLSRFIRDGKGYPYDMIEFRNLENAIGDEREMSVYLKKMEKTLNLFIDTEKLDSLVYVLIEWIREDDKIRKILYGSEFISKEQLLGTYAHKKQICVEALVLGLLYHTHKNPCISVKAVLHEAPNRITFHAVRYSCENALDTEYETDLIENIRLSAKRQRQEKCLYPLEFLCNDEVTSQLPEKGNLFIYGAGGAGKTTLLKSLINSDESVCFYLPLYSYMPFIYREFGYKPCRILLEILLKYNYQYEYQSYETLIANEGEKNVLKQLSLLENTFSAEPINERKWTILLDGLNEMSSERQEDFVEEIGHISEKWKNVRIIISGRNAPNDEVFNEFAKTEVLGITDKALVEHLADKPISDKLRELLKIPLFLNIYESQNITANTRGELLDSCFSNYKGSMAVRFLVQFVLPLVSRKMLKEWCQYEISRAEVLELIDKAIKLYVNDDYVYQDYIAPRSINKKSLLKSRRRTDWIELLIKNTGLMAESENDARYLHFSHQYYRDYFAAKHIINAVNIFKTGSVNNEDKEKYFSELGLSGVWFSEINYIPEKIGIYELIGEICGEYRNDVHDEDFYTYTVLDDFLDICRKFEVEYSVGNVILVKKLIHNNIICGVNFSGLELPHFMPSNIRFSLDGENPCDFSGCRVYRIADRGDALDDGYKNCDFTNATFLDMEVKEKVAELGGVVDFDDDRFMNEFFHEIALMFLDMADSFDVCVF